MIDWSTICFCIGFLLFLLIKWDILQGTLYSLLFDSMGVSLYLMREMSGGFTERLIFNIGVPVVILIAKGVLLFLIVKGWKKVRRQR